MIALGPYSDDHAMAVLSRLDPWDWAEAEATRGAPVTHLQLFAEWRAMQAARVASWVVFDHETRTCPFALLALAHTGQRGVAGAALLARDHRRFRRPLVELARRVRDGIAGYCAEAGIHRIEARAWAGHPRASAFLALTGFTHECDMPGFGRAGEETFRQFAWRTPDVAPDVASSNPEREVAHVPG
jgi:hypothetical protein